MIDEIKTAVLLVGGEGTRLKPYTDNRPKPLVEVAGKTILEWNTDWLKSYGIENIVFGCGNKRSQIEEFMKKNNNLGFKSVNYSENSMSGGTSEAFKRAIERYVLDENYVAMNGDEITNMDLKEMFNQHQRTKAVVTMALVPFECPYSVIEISKTNMMVSDFKYGKTLRDVPISIGIYIFNKEINPLIPNEGSIEKIVFSKLAKEGRIAPYILYTKEEWVTINDAKQRIAAEEALKRWGLV